jgi:AcrR family transcriptional regulator
VSPTARAERRRQTEERILEVARGRFAEVGYERTTIRAVAGAAEVDPALVMQYFGSKAELFRRAARVPPDEPLPTDPGRLSELLLAIIEVKLGEPSVEALPLLRSMFTHPEATERMRESLAGQVTQYAAAQPGDQAELRAALLVAWMLGLTLTRNLLGLGPLRDAPAAEVVALLRPCFRALIEESG